MPKNLHNVFHWKNCFSSSLFLYISSSYTFAFSYSRFQEEMKNWRFICFDEWLRMSKISFFCCCFSFFCTIHSIKLEFAVNLLNNTIRFSKETFTPHYYMTIYLFHFVVKIPYGSPSFLIICDIKNYINQIRCLTSRTFHFSTKHLCSCALKIQCFSVLKSKKYS